MLFAMEFNCGFPLYAKRHFLAIGMMHDTLSLGPLQKVNIIGEVSPQIALRSSTHVGDTNKETEFTSRFS